MPPTPTFHFILYTRAWCHLCETMLTELQAIKGSQPWQIDYIDIDATSTLNPELTERYDQLIPVLTGAPTQPQPQSPSEYQQICHYHLNPTALANFLQTNSPPENQTAPNASTPPNPPPPHSAPL